MSLYAITTALTQGITREHWGLKIRVPVAFDPETGSPTQWEDHDTGVQPPWEEFMARLQSQAPIDLAGPLKVNTNGFPIIVNNVTVVDGGGGDPPPGDGGHDTGQALSDVSVSVESTQNLTATGNITVDGCDVTIDITIGGTITNNVTITKSYITVFVPSP